MKIQGLSTESGFNKRYFIFFLAQGEIRLYVFISGTLILHILENEKNVSKWILKYDSYPENVLPCHF